MRKTTKEFVKQAQLLNPNYDYSQVSYKTNKDKVKIICDKGHSFMQTPNHHLRGEKCPYCYNNIQLTTKDFIERARKIHNNKYDYSLSKYKNALTPITIKCNKGHIFKMKPQIHLYSCSGCPICMSEKRSSGERKIRWLLTQNKIEFEEQKTFNGCKYKQLLLFDFYLPQYNLCIEYQGLQHYKSANWYGGEKEFKIRQIRDNIKREFCKNNNIDLLEIKYNESISNKLNKYILNKGEN